MVRNIIFDLGHVLVNVDYTNFRKILENQGVNEETYDSFFTMNRYRDLGYEAGKITTDEFIDTCITGLNLKMKHNEFARAFNDMFSEIKEMSSLVRRLSSEGSYNLFLLSNTSPLHFTFIKENYDYVNLLHKFGLSYELKCLKPEREIYERAVNHLGIAPSESVLIDDLRENCEAAEQFGIKSICYDKNNHAAFIEKFNKIIHQN